MFRELAEFLRPLPLHLRRLWGPHIGTQILFAQGVPIRIPKAGKTTKPYYHDHSQHQVLTAETVVGVAVSGWDWPDQKSVYVTFDIDSVLNHGDGLSAEQLAAITAKLMEVPEVELIRSKSGHGLHARLYFDPQPWAMSHTEHARNGARALAWLAQKTGLPLQSAVDACGKMAWIWHSDARPGGFQLLKEAH